jgi:hypothetical protein
MMMEFLVPEALVYISRKKPRSLLLLQRRQSLA